MGNANVSRTICTIGSVQETILTPLRILRFLLFASACGWGTSSFAVKETMMGDETLPQLIEELQHMSPDQRDKTFQGFNEELARASALELKQKRQWLKQQLAALSPEQRDLLHRQVLEHWERLTPEQLERIREIHQQRTRPSDDNPGRQEYCPPRLSPDERQEFHQWMRIRRDGPPQ
jgi:hypothetical protein